MKRQLLAILSIGMLAAVVSAEDKPAESKPVQTEHAFKDEKEKVSYAIGMSTGTGLANNIKRADVDADMDALFQGIKDSLNGSKTLLTEAEEREVLQQFSQDLQKKQMEKRRMQADKNNKEGEDFLAENKSKPGVVTTASGLQYKILSEGAGESPKPGDQVSVNYWGKLPDGTEFDSSYKRGQPATFGVTGVIHGWTEALELMKPGAKYELWIPGELAYGQAGHPPAIGPDQALHFEVELLSVTPGTPPPPAQPLTSDIIKVPSAEELKKGAKIETIKPEDIEKERAKEKAKESAPKQ